MACLWLQRILQTGHGTRETGVWRQATEDRRQATARKVAQCQTQTRAQTVRHRHQTPQSDSNAPLTHTRRVLLIAPLPTQLPDPIQIHTLTSSKGSSLFRLSSMQPIYTMPLNVHGDIRTLLRNGIYPRFQILEFLLPTLRRFMAADP